MLFVSIAFFLEERYYFSARFLKYEQRFRYMQRFITRPSFAFSSTLPAFNYQPATYSGTPYDQVLTDRRKYMPHFNTHYYKEPLLITQGKMQYLFDHKGNRYQDWISGISTVSLGHSHPALVAAIQKQNAKLVHTSSIMVNDVQAKYAKMLCEKLGPGFDTVYFCNSGGEANDFAIQLAKLYTQNNFFLSLRNGYHGMVGTAGNVTNLTNWVSPVTRVFGHEKLAWPSQYRSIHRSLEGLKRDAQQVISSNTTGKVAGILFEPIQGLGGICTHTEGYHQMIADLVRNHGGLVISDEVQTGFARVGKKYWGFKHYGFKPDIVSMAKGIANGLPLAAVATRREIAQVMNFTYFNTVGGGPIQCIAGMQTLKIIDSEKLDENAENVGNYLLAELKKIRENSTVVGDSRGAGLMIGIEIVKDRQSHEPAMDKTMEIMEKLRERFILLGRGGGRGNILRLQPTLCMSMDDAKYFIHHFGEIVSEYK